MPLSSFTKAALFLISYAVQYLFTRVFTKFGYSGTSASSNMWHVLIAVAMTCAFSFSPLCFTNKSLYNLGKFSSPAVLSSPHICFIICFHPPDTMNYVLTSYVLIYCVISCVSPTAVIVVCARSSWIANASSWYTGIPDVLICSGGICWWCFGLCWGHLAVGYCYPDIPMCCVGNIWLNRECAHRLAYGGIIPRNCDWDKKCLASLSLHFTIMR